MGNSIPFRKTCRTVGFRSQKVTSNREGGQRTCFSWVFMVRIQVTINSASRTAEEDFMHRFVFSPLPPPLRFRRERLLPSLRSSSSLLYIRSFNSPIDLVSSFDSSLISPFSYTLISFRTSTSNTPRPSAHHSFRPRPQRGEYKIMGSKLSDASLGTTARPRSRARVFLLPYRKQRRSRSRYRFLVGYEKVA